MIDDTQKKIIVVDDVQFLLYTIDTILKKHYEVHLAQTTEMLYEHLGKFIPDLIILDINMPDVNGFETIKQLKENECYANIPVIFLTGKSDKRDMQNAIKAMELGAADYLTKPIKDEQLIECVENQLNPVKLEVNKPVILAVDDSMVVLQEIHFMLENQYKVLTLPEPGRLMDLLQRITPDLFILDVKMPNISGFDLILMIREIPVHTQTPIIFLTTEGTIENVSIALNLSASDFLVKPINKDLLLDKIATRLTGYQIRRRMRLFE